MTIFELILSPEPLEPETISQLNPTLTPQERELVLVTKVIRDTNFVHEDIDVFENAVMVINDITPSIYHMEGSKPEWIWRAVTAINTIRPDVEFSDEVLRYIKFTFNNDGIRFYPPNIGLDNPILEEVIEKATKGPFPLHDDTHINIQAIKYLKLQEYINGGK